MLGGAQPPTLREDLALEARHYHLREQALRFLRVFVYTLGAQLLSGVSIASWAGLWSLLFACAENAYRQWRKTMPLPAAQRVADDHEPGAGAQPPAR
jgi:hypothetical protein